MSRFVFQTEVKENNSFMGLVSCCIGIYETRQYSNLI